MENNKLLKIEKMYVRSQDKGSGVKLKKKSFFYFLHSLLLWVKQNIFKEKKYKFLN